MKTTAIVFAVIAINCAITYWMSSIIIDEEITDRALIFPLEHRLIVGWVATTATSVAAVLFAARGRQFRAPRDAA